MRIGEEPDEDQDGGESERGDRDERLLAAHAEPLERERTAPSALERHRAVAADPGALGCIRGRRGRGHATR